MGIRRRAIAFLIIVLVSTTSCGVIIPTAATIPFSQTIPPASPAQTAPPATVQPVLGDTWTRSGDDMAMVYVSAGEFQMGSDYLARRAAQKLCQQYQTETAIAACGADNFADEAHVHPVVLDGFWLDRTEVTNGQYERCVEAGGCTPPVERGSYTRSSYYGDDAYRDYPVIWVTQQQAADYCAWAGARLPTEAEWEYAARGPEGRLFPWGDAFDGQRLNYCDANCTLGPNDPTFDDGYADTAPVGSFPAGASWCGALDMAGNVREWVADWYGPDPAERQETPTGPAAGELRVPRGGSWLDAPHGARTAQRGGSAPDYARYKEGFRCANR